MRKPNRPLAARRPGDGDWRWSAARRILLLAWLLAAVPVTPLLAPGAGQAQGGVPTSLANLHVVGSQLVNGSGQPVRLLGVNRSGSEFACVQGWGIFDGPSDLASVQAIATWSVNTVRVPLNESCWLGNPNVSAQYAGGNYQQAIADYVGRINQAGMLAILELHWSTYGTWGADRQEPMPNRAHSVEFWRQVATRFKPNSNVLFDLFNEPFPDTNGDSPEAWRCWRDGSLSATQNCGGGWYEMAGMQELVTAVRDTGAANVILLGGVQYSNSLSQWLSYRPTDPLNNLVASWHVYNINACNTQACWDTRVAPVAAQVPLVAGEIGQNDCQHAFIDDVMSWLDNRGASYLGWTWNTWNCATGPALISDYNGTPTVSFGQGFQAHVASVLNNGGISPTPTPRPSATPTQAATPPPLAAPPPLPRISVGQPAFASTQYYPASHANNDNDDEWRGYTLPVWLAYDLSSVPTAQRTSLLVAWYNNSYGYDIASPTWGVVAYNEPRDYKLQGHTAPHSGSAPTAGWVDLVSVVGNTQHSRQHSLSFAGYNWLRLYVTGVNGQPQNMDVALNMDVHDASNGVQDSILMLGDSITSGSAGRYSIGTNPASLPIYRLINAVLPSHYPAFENGAVGGYKARDVLVKITSTNTPIIDQWLSNFPGRYVTLNFGTNEANGCESATAYRSTMRILIAKVQSAGKVPIIPILPWANTANIISCGPAFVQQIQGLWAENPAIVHGPDLWSLFQGHTDWFSDNLHPNDVGTSAWRNAWRDALVANVYGVAGPALAASSTPTAAVSATRTGTPTAIPLTATSTATNTATAVPPTATTTPLPTATQTFLPSPTRMSTATAVPPSATPSATPLPTSTATPLPSATATRTNTASPTALPPTATATRTATPLPTSTGTTIPSATATATRTATAVPPTATATAVPPTATATSTSLPSATATSLPTNTATPTPTATAVVCPTGQWRAEYFNNRSLTGPSVLTRCEASIANDWSLGTPPGVAVGTDNFSVRWSGQHAFTAGDYAFVGVTDDGMRAWLDNTLLIDAWHDQGPTQYTATRTLTAGVHDLKVEYYEAGGGATAQFHWDANVSCPTGQWRAEYFNNRTLTGPSVLTRCETSIDNDWGLGSPPGVPVGTDGFSVRWTGRQTFGAGAYTFVATGDDGIRAFLDNTPIIDGWGDHGPTEYRSTQTLTAGDHDLKVEFYENGGGATAKFRWDTSCPVGQWRAEYFPNRTLTGIPALTRCEPSITNDWGLGTPPGVTVGVDNFSVRWSGQFTFAAGSYTFIGVTDDGMRVWLDNTLLIDAWFDQGPTQYTATRTLPAGVHDLRVEYYEDAGGATAQFRWQ